MGRKHLSLSLSFTTFINPLSTLTRLCSNWAIITSNQLQSQYEGLLHWGREGKKNTGNFRNYELRPERENRSVSGGSAQKIYKEKDISTFSSVAKREIYFSSEQALPHQFYSIKTYQSLQHTTDFKMQQLQYYCSNLFIAWQQQYDACKSHTCCKCVFETCANCQSQRQAGGFVVSWFP